LSAWPWSCGFSWRVTTGLFLLLNVAGVSLVPGKAMAQASGAADAGKPAAPPAEAQKPPAAAAPKVRSLDIWEIVVEGNTVLEEGTIDDAVEPFLGPQKTAEDVDKARAALEEVYRKRGFKTVAVAIPRQTVVNGVVHLQVLETRVEHLNVVGSHYHSIDRIKEEAPSMAEGGVPDFNQVQKDIVALNMQPDQKVTPSLKAGSTTGTVDIDLAVDDKLPLHGSLELNNRKSQSTSELRSTASLSYDNLWQLGHSLSLSYQTAPEHQADAIVLYGSYLAPFVGTPFSLLLNGINSNSNVATVGGTDVVGKGQVGGIRGVYLFPGSDTAYRTLTFGVDYKHFDNLTSLAGSSFETPITYFPFTVDFSEVDRRSTAILQGDISATWASIKLGSNTPALENNRYNARGEQLSFKANFSWTQDLPAALQSYTHISGQYSNQPLVTNEQLAVGGWDTVRGYLEAEALGDTGFSGTFELRSPPLFGAATYGKSKGRLFQDFRLFGFVDGAQLRVNDPNTTQQSRFALFSGGAGANFQMFSFLNGAIDWADPFLNGPATQGWHSRVLFRVWATF
jgi:hemolysin activation/secretion protein